MLRNWRRDTRSTSSRDGSSVRPALMPSARLTVLATKYRHRRSVPPSRIGHIKGRYQNRRHSLMVRERWAWQWARDNALIWTPRMEQMRAGVAGILRSEGGDTLAGHPTIDFIAGKTPNEA